MRKQEGDETQAWIRHFEGYVPYTWVSDTIIEPDKYYKLNPLRLFGYPIAILSNESGVSRVMWSYVMNGKFVFSDIVLTHICDRFAVPKSLVKDLCKWQQEEWRRRKGISDKPCRIPSHYAHYFDEIELSCSEGRANKDNPSMQARYARMRGKKTMKTAHAYELAERMIEHFHESDQKKARMARKTADGIQASRNDGDGTD